MMEAVYVSEHGGPETVMVEETGVPEPGPGQVRIAVRAAGVNFADLEKRRGSYPDGPTPPYVPGMEVAGIVDEVGADPEDGVGPSVGDRVAAFVDGGGYAERAVASAKRTVRLPAALSWTEAVAVPVQWVTAHNVLHEWGGLEAGERVLINAAAGGVGSAAVQLADVAGAEVIGTASTPEKRDLASELGATIAIDYESDDVAARIDRHTDGRGVDLALDGVGGRAFTDAVDALAPGGRIVTFGMASGTVPTVATPRLFFENRTVIGYHLEEALDRTPNRPLSAVPRVVERLERGEVEVVVGDTFPLRAAETAHRRLEDRNTTGKIVLLPGEPGEGSG